MSGGTDKTEQTNSQSVQQLPPWINNAAQQNYALAQNTSQRPLQQYQGQMVADVAPQTQQAWDLAANSGNVGADQYNAAQSGYLGVMGQQPQQVTAGQLSNTDLTPYMNPYTSSVINKTLPILQQNLGVQQAGNQAQAAGANAYGGSRQGIQQGVAQAQGAQDMAQMASTLNQYNFGQAQTAAGQDIAGRLKADLANQSTQQAQGGLNVQAAAGLAGLGKDAQLNQARNFTELTTAGGEEQQQAQNQINAQMQKFSQAWGYPYQQLGTVQSALGMTPYATATQGQQTTQTQTSADPFTSVLGGLTSLGSLFSVPATGGTSAASGLLSSLSDRKMKTDIAQVGRHPSGAPLFSYRYKGDPKSYPKVVGPMAEDVAKIAPHAVAPIPGGGGKMMVHMPTLNAIAPPAPLGRVGGPQTTRGLSIGAPRGNSAAGMPSLPGMLSGAPGLMGPTGPPPGLMGPSPMGPPPGLSAAPPGRRRIRPPQIRGALGG